MLDKLPKLNPKEQNFAIKKHSAIIKLASQNACKTVKSTFMSLTKKIR